MKASHILLILIIMSFSLLPGANAQELFPLTEPASTMPKGVMGLRTVSEFYKQAGELRNMSAVRIMYGISPRWTSYLSIVGSNHHGDDYPSDYPSNHTHNYPIKYPFRIIGGHLYNKYRFLSIDRPHRHFRMALYHEISLLQTAHDEAEPNLLDDNSGLGAGLITTYLHQKMAFSFTVGLVKPFTDYGKVPDPLPMMPFVPIKIVYPASYVFDISLGYLVFPRQYKNFRQINLSVYVELKGKKYGASEVFVANPVMNISENPEYYRFYSRDIPMLGSGTFIDANYGLQLILGSNLRIDCSIRTSLYSKSFARNYPGIHFGVQKFFYRS